MEANHIDLDAVLLEACSTPTVVDTRTLCSSLAAVLLRETGFKFSLGPAPVEKIANCLNIVVSVETTPLTEAALLGTSEEWQAIITPKQTDSRQGNRTLSPRGRFSLAHEVSHFIFERLMAQSHGLPNTTALAEMRNDRRSLERFCDTLASDLLFPQEVLDRSEAFESLLGDLRGELSERAIALIDNLARALWVSRFVIIGRLNRSWLLDRMQWAAMISFYGVNRRTDREPALRVLFAANPTWGFIPTNTRAVSLGFESMTHTYSIGSLGDQSKFAETVELQQASVIENGKFCKLKRVKLATSGIHMKCPFGRDGKYVLTVFEWPRPM